MKQFGVILFCLITQFYFSQTWSQKADLPGTSRNDATCFSIGTNVYILTGNTGTGYLNDLWCFNTLNNSWSQKQSLPFAGRYDVMTFTINGTGFAFGGRSAGGVFNDDLFAYDTLTDSWTQKANCPGGPRSNGVAFSIGLKGYICTGRSAGGDLNDLWEYDFVSDSWTQKANFPGTPRQAATGFALGNKVYVGTGVNTASALTVFNDFYMYNPANDSWTQKANYPGTARFTCVSFGIGPYGFLGTGLDGSFNTTDEFYQYDTLANTWTATSSFPNGLKSLACATSCNGKGYFGTGTTTGPAYSTEWWEFAPVSTSLKSNAGLYKDVSIFPNPCHENLTIKMNEFSGEISLKLLDVSGKCVKQSEIRYSNYSINISTEELAPGIYGVLFISQDGHTELAKQKIVRIN